MCITGISGHLQTLGNLLCNWQVSWWAWIIRLTMHTVEKDSVHFHVAASIYIYVERIYKFKILSPTSRNYFFLQCDLSLSIHPPSMHNGSTVHSSAVCVSCTPNTVDLWVMYFGRLAGILVWYLFGVMNWGGMQARYVSGAQSCSCELQFLLLMAANSLHCLHHTAWHSLPVSLHQKLWTLNLEVIQNFFCIKKSFLLRKMTSLPGGCGKNWFLEKYWFEDSSKWTGSEVQYCCTYCAVYYCSTSYAFIRECIAFENCEDIL
jgi:hypothetical protein